MRRLGVSMYLSRCSVNVRCVHAVGTRGSVCQTRCVSDSRVRRTATAVCDTISATSRRTSVSTAGTGRPVRRSATAASDTRTASASGKRRRLTDAATWSAVNASERCDPPISASLPSTHSQPQLQFICLIAVKIAFSP